MERVVQTSDIESSYFIDFHAPKPEEPGFIIKGLTLVWETIVWVVKAIFCCACSDETPCSLAGRVAEPVFPRNLTAKAVKWIFEAWGFVRSDEENTRLANLVVNHKSTEVNIILLKDGSVSVYGYDRRQEKQYNIGRVWQREYDPIVFKPTDTVHKKVEIRISAPMDQETAHKLILQEFAPFFDEYNRTALDCMVHDLTESVMKLRVHYICIHYADAQNITVRAEARCHDSLEFQYKRRRELTRTDTIHMINGGMAQVNEYLNTRTTPDKVREISQSIEAIANRATVSFRHGCASTPRQIEMTVTEDSCFRASEHDSEKVVLQEGPKHVMSFQA